jgi:hypothetical protein
LNAILEKSALAQFCVDLTMRASGGLIDPVIGRKDEIERVVQIICRRTKNNPILLGEAGVGKTAIAEGLALRIANGDVPIFLVVRPTGNQCIVHIFVVKFHAAPVDSYFLFKSFNRESVYSLWMLLSLWRVQKRGVNWKPGLLVYYVKYAKQVI